MTEGIRSKTSIISQELLEINMEIFSWIFFQEIKKFCTSINFLIISRVYPAADCTSLVHIVRLFHNPRILGLITRPAVADKTEYGHECEKRHHFRHKYHLQKEIFYLFFSIRTDIFFILISLCTEFLVL